MASNISAYLTVLKELCETVRYDPIPEEVRAALSVAPCLIGYVHGAKVKPKDGKRPPWSAVCASECFIGDNTRCVLWTTGGPYFLYDLVHLCACT